MTRTQGRLDSDSPYHDGHLFLSPIDAAEYATSGTVATTRTAAGNYHIDLSASSSVTLQFALSGLLFRTGLQDYLQEAFGAGVVANAGAAANGLRTPAATSYLTASATKGTNVNLAVQTSGVAVVGQAIVIDTVASGVQETCVVSVIPDATHITVASLANNHSSLAPLSGNAFTTPAGVSGPPPFSGISQFNSVVAPRPKGLAFRNLYPAYTVTTAALSAATIGLTKTTLAQGALASAGITNILAAAANGMPLAAATGIIIPDIAITNNTFQTTKFTEYNLELVFTTSTGTASIYGVFIDFYFNYV